jgi:hypothetical protein
LKSRTPHGLLSQASLGVRREDENTKPDDFSLLMAGCARYPSKEK